MEGMCYIKIVKVPKEKEKYMKEFEERMFKHMPGERPEGFGPHGMHHMRRHHCMRPMCPPEIDMDDLDSLFRACSRMMHHEARGRFGSTQDRIIRILHENGGTMGQKALQQLLGVQPGSISEILSKMEEKELISRNKDEDDRRASLISLKNDELREEKRESFFEVLSEEEKETMKVLLRKVLESKKEKSE